MKYTFRFMLLAILLVGTGCASLVKPTATVYPVEDTIVNTVAIQPVERIELTVETPSIEVIPPNIETEASLARSFTERDLKCLAHNLYYEARGEGERGMAAVGYVVLNRIEHGGFPDTVCGVVYERTRGFCQFSWVCDKRRSQLRADQYEFVTEIAKNVLNGSISNPIGRSLFFHSRRIRTSFSRHYRHVADVGNHRFYSAP